MWKTEPTPEHWCPIPEGPMTRAEVQPIWQCDQCGVEYNVRIGGWHSWWSPVTATGRKGTNKFGHGTIYCHEEQFIVVYPRVEFESRTKVRGSTQCFSVNLTPEDQGEYPYGYEYGEIRPIPRAKGYKDREVNLL